MNARPLAAAILTLAAAFAIAVAPAAAGQTPVSLFALPPMPPVLVPAVEDGELDRLLSALDDALASIREDGGAPDAAASTLWSFARRLQVARLTEAQEARVLGRLEEMARRDATIAPLVDAPKHMIGALSPGDPAPEIVGRDLDGAAFRLSDYRGKVVVLMFTADWCGICRSLYPYERLLLDVYDAWPFAVVGVDASASPEAAVASQAKNQLSYRSWWDAPTDEAPDGPIAEAWNVRGRPTVYVIDGEGVIRFVDLRYEQLLQGVRQVMDEHMDRLDRAAAKTVKR